jgi:hypothetical protein
LTQIKAGPAASWCFLEASEEHHERQVDSGQWELIVDLYRDDARVFR